MPWVSRKRPGVPDKSACPRGLGRSQDSEQSRQSGASAGGGSEKASSRGGGEEGAGRGQSKTM